MCASVWAATDFKKPLIFPLSASDVPSTMSLAGSFDVTVSADTTITPESGDWIESASSKGRIAAIGNASADTTAIIKTSGDAGLTVRSESSGDLKAQRNYAVALLNGASFTFEGTGTFIASSDLDDVLARTLRSNSAGLFSMSGDINLISRGGQNSGNDNKFFDSYHNAYDGWSGTRARFSGNSVKFDVAINGASGSGADIVGYYDPETYEAPDGSPVTTVSLDAKQNVISVRLKSLSTLGEPKADDFYAIEGLNALTEMDLYVTANEYEIVTTAPVYVTASGPVSIDVSLEGTAAASYDVCRMVGVDANGGKSVVRLNNGVSVSVPSGKYAETLYARKGGKIYVKAASYPIKISGADIRAEGKNSLIDLTLNADSTLSSDITVRDLGTVSLSNSDTPEFAVPGVNLSSGNLALGEDFVGTADVLKVEGMKNNINVGSGAEMTFLSVDPATKGRLNLNGASADLANIIIPKTAGLTITYNDPYVESSGSSGCSTGAFGFAALLLAAPLLAVKRRRK